MKMLFSNPDALPPTLFWLVHTSVGASSLILCVLAFRGLFARWIPPGILYATGCVLLARLALPFVPASDHSFYSPIPESSLASIAEPGVLAKSPHFPLATSEPEFEPIAFPDIAVSADIIAPEPLPTALATSGPPIPMPGLAQYVWWAGIALFLICGMTRYLRLLRWARVQPECRDPDLLGLVAACRDKLQLRGFPRVRIVDRLRSAAVFGILKPEILLPHDLLARLSKTELRHVILHELAHIQRRDPLAGIAAHLVLAIHWFNPLVWITLRHLMADRELLCDEAVLRCLGKRERRPYGATLLRVLDLAPPPHPAAAALLPFLSNKPEIKRRITMIAKTKTTRSLPGALGAASILALLSLTLAAAPAQDREVDKEKPEAREREADREKPEAREREADREKPEAREHEADREKPEARERDGEREKPAVREDEKREVEARKPDVRADERAELMRAHEKEIQAAREEIGRLAREGKKEEAERLEAQLRQKLERLRAETRDRANAERPKDGDIEHLREEIGRLSREGKHDQAEQLEKRLRAKLGEREGDGREVRPGNPEELRRQLTELTELVRGMQHSMNEMREELHHLREERKSGE